MGGLVYFIIISIISFLIIVLSIKVAVKETIDKYEKKFIEDLKKQNDDV